MEQISEVIVKYEREDFFGNRTYTEDKVLYPSYKDLKKVFREFQKDHNFAFEMGNDVYFWENLSEFEQKLLTVRSYENKTCSLNYTVKKEDVNKLKKEIYKKFQRYYGDF